VPVLHVYGLDGVITGAELSIDFSPEYNRSFEFCYDFSAAGSLEFENLFSLQGGIEAGQTGALFDIKTFVSSAVPLPLTIPLSVSLSYIYNGLPGYEAHTNTLLPMVSLKSERMGFALGTTLRFSSYYGSAGIFEVFPAFSWFVLLYGTERLMFSLTGANYYNFAAENFDTLLLSVNNTVAISSSMTVTNELILHWTGMWAFAGGFYGIAYRGGVVCSW
jgi:hypothetical protein